MVAGTKSLGARKHARKNPPDGCWPRALHGGNRGRCVIPPGVSARSLTLAASVLLLAFTTYLFTQVRSGPDIGPSPEGHPGASAPGSSGVTSLGPAAGPGLGHSLGPLAPARATPPAPAPTEPTPSQPQAAPAPDPVTPVAPPALAAQIESSADSAFDEANRRYDQRDYDEARSLVVPALANSPGLRACAASWSLRPASWGSSTSPRRTTRTCRSVTAPTCADAAHSTARRFASNQPARSARWQHLAGRMLNGSASPDKVAPLATGKGK